MSNFYARDRDRTRYVYFIKPVGMDGPIKIGCSDQPENRLRSIMNWSPFPLEIVATTPGGFDLERALHGHFQNHFLRNEWFRPTPELRALIVKLAAGCPVEEAIDLSAGDRLNRSKSGITARKQGVTVTVIWAEKRAFGACPYGDNPDRPAHINRILKEWRASSDTSGMTDHEAVLLDYAAELKRRPAHPNYVAERARYHKPYTYKTRPAARRPTTPEQGQAA
ncbi:GIY-YIG nuclease family protein [Sphingomonas sp. 1P06PA]|uniref:GIY-YIG nuclease family protein n=1 Tax=Sphingomonas sp. 1P06PA TaxID=554121 RepID=UPI0039A660E4